MKPTGPDTLAEKTEIEHRCALIATGRVVSPHSLQGAPQIAKGFKNDTLSRRVSGRI